MSNNGLIMISCKGRIEILGALKTQARNVIRYAAGYVMARPKLKHAALLLLNGLPVVKSRISRILIGVTVSPAAQAHLPIDITDLPPRARRIYADLKDAIGNRLKENR